MCVEREITYKLVFISLNWDTFMRWLVIICSNNFNSEVAIINALASFNASHHCRFFKSSKWMLKKIVIYWWKQWQTRFMKLLEIKYRYILHLLESPIVNILWKWIWDLIAESYLYTLLQFLLLQSVLLAREPEGQ